MLSLIKAVITDSRFDSINFLKRQKPKLSNINIETAYACNMNCRSCFRKNKRRQNFMKLALFEKIIGELNRHNFSGQIYLHYAGEPLMHPQFSEILRIITKNNFSKNTNLYTNGLLLNEQNVKILKKYHISRINISLDGDSRYKKENSASNHYYIAEKNIKNLRQGYRSFFNITIHTVLFKQKESRINSMIKKLHPYINSFRVTPSLNCQEMKFNVHPLFIAPKYNLSLRTCPIIWQAMTVLTDGRLNACCFALGADKIIEGVNLNKISLYKAFNSKNYRVLRSAFLKRNFKKQFTSCKNCSAWRMGAYNLSKLRIEKINMKEFCVSNGYTKKYWFFNRNNFYTKVQK